MKNRENSSNKTTTQKEIKSCPHCNSEKIVKNGKKSGNQRYLCRGCNRTFASTNNTILFSSKKDIKAWQTYIHSKIKKYSLHETAKICGISVATAFTWRHKILDALQNMINEVKLDGIVEADETFMPLSFKGNHKNFNLPHLSKKRGSSASRCGLSKEQVCIPCGINLNELSVTKISNGKPSLKAIQKILDNGISKDSILLTDSFRAYLKLLNDMELNRIRIPRKKYISLEHLISK